MAWLPEFRAGTKRLFKHPDWPLVVARRAGRELDRALTRKLNFGGRYEFSDRSKGSDKVVIVVAGYKEYLWDVTLARIAKFGPKDIDVCIVCPAARPSRLMDVAAANGWSLLRTRANKLALAQNLAVQAHPRAQWIYKLDEDIFISEGYFQNLHEGYLRIRSQGVHDPGFCAPLLNVNGYSYAVFVRTLGIKEEYRAKFGELKSACMGVRAHWDPEAARWLWEKSLPFDEVAQFLRSQAFEYSVVPHRFSIGAIFFERAFWQEIGGFRTSMVDGELGVEEEDLCCKCVALSRPMCVVHTTFAGHFAFGPQESGMRAFLDEARQDFEVSDGRSYAAVATDKKQACLTP